MAETSQLEELIEPDRTKMEIDMRDVKKRAAEDESTTKRERAE